jgi:hypothetical protein
MLPLRLVIATNVVVSAALNPDGLKTAPRRKTRGLRFRFSMNWIGHGETCGLAPGIAPGPALPCRAMRGVVPSELPEVCC